MPLIAHSNLPTYSRLANEGGTVLTQQRAEQQDIRELHIGLLNMMPDAALEATERQFFRLVSESNQIAQFYIHPFTLDEIPRTPAASQHIKQYYESFEDIKRDGLDALIITGANVTQPDLSAEPFWKPLIEVIDWSYNNVTSTLCSCLATHAVMQFRHGVKRVSLAKKRWGVYSHKVVDRNHPLVNDVNTRFDVPHSRFNEIQSEQFKQAGLHVLVESETAGPHLVVSEDRFRVIYFQGHPEYDINSLLKEYKREVLRYQNGKRSNYPEYPYHYFRPQAKAIADEYQLKLQQALDNKREAAAFPEDIILQRLDNTWHDTAEAIINNWIGKVYQITGSDRKSPFMEGVDANNPLELA